MATELTMPQMGYDMQEGTVLRWLKGEGDAVTNGEPIAEIETDKAVVEFESYADGVLHRIIVPAGTTVPVGEPIAVVGAQDEFIVTDDEPADVDEEPTVEAELEDAPSAAIPMPPASAPPVVEETEPEPEVEQPPAPATPLRASPIARRIADERGIDISKVTGTGPGGRIVKDDVLAYEEPEPEEPEVVEEPEPEVEEAVVEAESRAHYAERVRMMDSIQPPSLVGNVVTGWVERRTRELDDHRTQYETRFTIVSDGLWHSYGLDIGEFANWTPADVRRELELEVHRRLSVHRDRLGSKRFSLAVAECRLNAADELWPTRLAHLGDMATTLSVGAPSRHAAVTELAEEIAGTRSEFWAQVEDQAMRTLLNSADIAGRSRMGDNHVEPLPDELEALLR